MAVRTNTVRPHSAPGLYFKEEVQTYANKSIGITTLGVTGETLRGPAFQPIPIKNWREFQTYFGGTSTAKYKGSQYPRYELPYIAKSYLEQSEQLEVVRVLGLSGVNAGPAWIITATKHKLYNGYTYDSINYDPYAGDESKWSAKCTFASMDDMPTPPNITEDDCDKARVFDHYEWRTVCDNCDGSRVGPQNTFDPSIGDVIPDANDTLYDYMKVIQRWFYTEEATPSQSTDSYTEVDSIPSNPTGDDSVYNKYIKIITKEAIYMYYESVCQYDKVDTPEHPEDYIVIGRETENGIEMEDTTVYDYVFDVEAFYGKPLMADISLYVRVSAVPSEIDSDSPEYIFVRTNNENKYYYKVLTDSTNSTYTYVDEPSLTGLDNFEVFPNTNVGYDSPNLYYEANGGIENGPDFVSYHYPRGTAVGNDAGAKTYFFKYLAFDYDGTGAKWRYKSIEPTSSEMLEQYTEWNYSNWLNVDDTYPEYVWTHIITHNNTDDVVNIYRKNMNQVMRYDNSTHSFVEDKSVYPSESDFMNAERDCNTVYTKVAIKGDGVTNYFDLTRTGYTSRPYNPQIEYTDMKTVPSPITENDPYAVRITELPAEYAYYKKENIEHCYEKVSMYKYFTKVWKKNLQLPDEDDSEGIDGNKNNVVIGVIRSRGEHKKAAFVRTPTESDIANGICEDVYKRDGIEYYAKTVCLEPSKSLTLDSSCNPGFSTNTGDFTIDNYNYGTFTIAVGTSDGETKRYSVSLNPGDKNYIYNVIGGTPDDGDSEIYIEELYDVALRQLVENGSINAINSELLEYPAVNIVPKFEDVNDLLVDSALNRSYRGKRYLYSSSLSSGITVRYSVDGGQTWVEGEGMNGMIYTVLEKTDPTTGKKFYFYGAYVKDLTCEYQKMEDCPNITWYDCDDTMTGAVQNSFDEEPSFFANPSIDDQTYIRVFDTDSEEYVCYKKVIIDIVEESEGKKHTERLSEYDFCKDVNDGVFVNCVNVLSDGTTYVNTGGDVYPITLDFNNYREQYRYASTPWIVSEVKGSAEQVELNKLFRFHTISDGNNSSFEVKISIENIDPSTGRFDVLVRSFNDSDYNPNVLERYVGCTLVPGDPDYISLKIGSFDELYNSVSNYITVEVNENDVTKLSIPAGFLGYPVRDYSGLGINKSFKYELYTEGIPSTLVDMEAVPCHATCDDPEYIDVNGKIYHKVEQKLSTDPKQPYFKFNTAVDNDMKIKKQYFGVSDLVGIDTDIFSYKGVEAYNGVPSGLTPCFHLDARIINGTPNANGEVSDGSVTQIVSVDGVTGYTWSTVNKNITTSEGIEPRIGSEEVMTGTIYEDKKYRKFTVAFYGGWDGWDYFRTSRSTSNEFRYKDYKGFINSTSGYGEMFNILKNPDAFDFDATDKIITSDYYAFLAGARQFNNPKSIEINVLATPGIDYVNNGHLVNEIIDMVEEERADCVYIVTTPDKPFGASDAKDEMYTAEEAVANLEDSDIDSNHTASYYPWVKYFDVDNSEYIYLPVTRDVVKSIALTDNQAFPWYAAAGWNRGNISGVAPKRKLKQGEQDTLYDGRLNFVASFAQEGDKIWGDKDLQILDNQLNRLSARRLLLRIKRMLKTSCIGLLFDPNDANASKAVRSAVSSVLDYVKDNRGISDYRIEIDDSASVRDQMGLGVTYYLRRNPMLEWISFTSVLTPQGMEW